MPELPEVESARRLAQRRLAKKKILRVAVVEDHIVFENLPPRQFSSTLRGRRVLRVQRYGKHIWMELDRRPWPMFHFGMTGWFHFYRRAADRPAFWKMEWLMNDGTRFAHTDVRRLGRIRLRREPQKEPPLILLGFDPYLGLPEPTWFLTELRKRKAPIKAVLLDQSFSAGVGNWIADEVLYQSGIAPHRRASTLRKREVYRLRSTLKRVIELAVRTNADSEKWPRTWLFHSRWGRRKNATTARGEPIRFKTIAGRTAAWVPSRQH